MNTTNHMKLLMPILIGLFFAAAASADYDMAIGNGYRYSKCNSIETGITAANSSTVIFTPYSYANVGPIERYATNKSHIFLRNVGRKNRSLFPGDTFQEVDNTKTFFFIINKSDDSTIGPLTLSQFNKSPAVLRAELINWNSPRNPFINRVLTFFAIALAFAILVILWLCRRLIE